MKPPSRPTDLPQPNYIAKPASPDPDDARYQPRLSLIAKMLRSVREARLKEAQQVYQAALATWEMRCLEVEDQNRTLKTKWQRDQESRLAAWQHEIAHTRQANIDQHAEWKRKLEEMDADEFATHARWKAQVDAMQQEHTKNIRTWREGVARIEKDFAERLAKWEVNRAAYIEKQKANHLAIDQKRMSYLACDPDAVRDYCEMVLANSAYPDGFPQEFDLGYQSDGHLLIVEYILPNLASIPTLKEVQYLTSKDEFKEVHRATAATHLSLTTRK